MILLWEGGQVTRTICADIRQFARTTGQGHNGLAWGQGVGRHDRSGPSICVEKATVLPCGVEVLDLL